MIDFLVIITEIALITLLGWLLYTLYLLSHSDDQEDEYVETDRYSKVESLTGTQIFAGIQIMDARRQGLQPKNMKQDWIVQSTALYLLGAAETIAEHFECCISDTREVMLYMLTRNLELGENKAEHLIQNFELNTVSDDDKESSASGRKAAISWLKNKFTPDEDSLIATIRTRGVA